MFRRSADPTLWLSFALVSFFSGGSWKGQNNNFSFHPQLIRQWRSITCGIHFNHKTTSWYMDWPYLSVAGARHYNSRLFALFYLICQYRDWVETKASDADEICSPFKDDIIHAFIFLLFAKCWWDRLVHFNKLDLELQTQHYNNNNNNNTVVFNTVGWISCFYCSTSFASFAVFIHLQCNKLFDGLKIMSVCLHH